MTLRAILISLSLFCFITPANAEDGAGALEGYTPPPMFDTDGYDDATIRESVGYKDPIEKEVIEHKDSYVLRSEEDVKPSFTNLIEDNVVDNKPPLPPRRPVKTSLSKEYAEKIRKEFENGARAALSKPRSRSKHAPDLENSLEDSLVDPSAEDLLNYIDPQD